MAKPPPVPFFVLNGHIGNISTLYFNNEMDNTLKIKPTLLSGSEIGEIFIWNLESFRTLFRLSSPEKTTVLFLNYYKSTLLSQTKEGILNFWKYCNNDWIVTQKFKTGNVGYCSSDFWFNEDGSYFSLFNQDSHTLEIYNFDQEKKTKSLRMRSSSGLCMCLKVVNISDKLFVIAGYENGDIGLWDYEENCEKSSLNFHKEIITCLDFDSQFKMRGISGSTDENLAVWKINQHFKLENVLQLKLPNSGVNNVKIRLDGKIVIIAGSDCNIRVYSWKTLKPLAILSFHEQSVQYLTFSSALIEKKNSVFASGSKDKNIALWTIY